MSYLRRAGKNGGRVYLFAESWPLCVDDVQFVEKILRERMMVVGASSPACWTLWLSVFLPGDRLFAGTEECLVFALTLACYTPQLCCSLSAVNRLGQQVLMRCTTDHTTRQLLTQCCVCVHMATDLKHTLNPSLPQTCVWNLEANSHCYSQASSSQVLYGIISVIILKLIALNFTCNWVFFLWNNLDWQGLNCPSRELLFYLVSPLS